MQKIVCLIVILICINAFCFAEEKQEESEIKNEKEYYVAVHLHPISLILPRINTYKNSPPFLLYTTIEIPISSLYSFIIKPSLINNVPGLFSDIEWFRIGTDLGLRCYKNDKGSGFYIQPTFGLFHSTIPEDNYQNYPITTDTVSFFQIDMMLYIGGSINPNKTNLSIFFDVGFGYGSGPYIYTRSENTIRFDFNFGLGFRF